MYMGNCTFVGNSFPSRPVTVSVVPQGMPRSDSSSSSTSGSENSDSQALLRTDHDSEGRQGRQKRNGSRQHTPGSASPQGQEILHSQTEVGSVCL